MSRLPSRCNPPIHHFDAAERTCQCGEVEVPQLAGRDLWHPPGALVGSKKGALARRAVMQTRAAEKKREEAESGRNWEPRPKKTRKRTPKPPQ